MTNDETIMPKESPNPNDKIFFSTHRFRIGHWEFFSHSDLGISDLCHHPRCPNDTEGRLQPKLV
jgi:hypothetical protein